ncbi:MAG TPA: hypothetical protein VF608_10405 [Thermoanaerobaculia bacterium]
MRMRFVAALAYTGAAFLFGVALGERGELGFVQSIFTFVIPIATVIMTVAAKRNRALVLFTGIVMLSGLLLGQHHFERAWDECLVEGERLHARLEAFYAKNDGYPSRLEDLDGDVPCRCGFRPTILHYLSNERGFRLWMTNDRETIRFTASGRSSNRRSS